MGRSHGPGPAGVEEIIEVLCGMGMLLGSRIATPAVWPVRFDAFHGWASPDGVPDVVVRGGLRTG